MGLIWPFNKGFCIVTTAMKVRSEHEALYDSKFPFFLRNVVQRICWEVSQIDIGKSFRNCRDKQCALEFTTYGIRSFMRANSTDTGKQSSHVDNESEEEMIRILFVCGFTFQNINASGGL